MATTQSPEELIQFTTEKIDSGIQQFTQRRKRMFNVVRGFKYPLVALTAASTIILGLDLGAESITVQKNWALVIGALVTGLSTLMTFWNVEEYWVKNKVIELQLISLKESFEFEKRQGVTPLRVQEYFQQYQRILEQQEALWKATLDSKSDNSSDSGS